LAASTAFYDATLTSLGVSRLMDFQVAIGYGTDRADFWISQAGEAAGPNRESHIAFAAADRASVDAFFRAAVAAGAEVLHEPKLRPEYHEHYYGAFVRDPDGNNVEAVCHRPE
jgi:catechol 2,3-dioxygenase-like lactoylglutathione lyase family enzyme